MNLKRLAFVFQAVVTAALLALLFRKFDWALFQSAFTRTPLWFYLVSFGVLVAGQALYVFKWGLVLDAMGLRVPFWRLAEQYLLESRPASQIGLHNDAGVVIRPEHLRSDTAASGHSQPGDLPPQVRLVHPEHLD